MGYSAGDVFAQYMYPMPTITVSMEIGGTTFVPHNGFFASTLKEEPATGFFLPGPAKFYPARQSVQLLWPDKHLKMLVINNRPFATTANPKTTKEQSIEQTQ